MVVKIPTKSIADGRVDLRFAVRQRLTFLHVSFFAAALPEGMTHPSSPEPFHIMRREAFRADAHADEALAPLGAGEAVARTPMSILERGRFFGKRMTPHTVALSNGRRRFVSRLDFIRS